MEDLELLGIYEKAKELYNAKKFNEALPLLTALLKSDAYRLRANTNIGGCLLHLGHIKAGLKFTNRALDQQDNYAPALINKAEAYLAIASPEVALQIYTNLAQEYPENISLLYGLSKSLHLSNDDHGALEILETYLIHSPSDIGAILLKGEIQSNLHDNISAIRTFGVALEIEPKNPKTLSNLGVVMMRLNNMTAALKYLDKVLEINPNSMSDLRRKAQVLYSMSEVAKARECFYQAFELNRGSASLCLSRFLLIPGIPASAAEIEQARARFIEGLYLAEVSYAELVLDTECESIPHLFYLAYHDRDDRDIIERYINLMRKLSSPFLPLPSKLAECQEKTEHGINNRIKIGFLSSYFSSHSNCFAFEGLIAHLDRERFEVYLIHTSLSVKDAARDRLDSLCDHSIQLTNNLHEIDKTLRSLFLDILYFTDLGMNSYDFLIPFLKSARVQITGWGIPHTSGIHEIDYYISSEDLEPQNAQSLYTEKLIKLPGGIPCCFLDTSLTLYSLPREYFILPPEGRLVGCLQSLHKLHPDFDYVLEEIARRNPDVGFVFVEDRLPERTKKFIERLQNNAPLVHERMITYSLMNRAEYHSLCNCIDLLLDPIYYGSGITFFEASFVGTPIVTLEGKYLRSRIVASGYREMKLSDPPITHSISEYVNLATSLLHDTPRRELLKSEILRLKHRIFNRLDYVYNFEKFCAEAVKESEQMD